MSEVKKTKAVLMEELEQKNQELRELREEIKKLDKYKQYADTADEIKAIHDSFVNSGFDEDQAFKLVLKIIEMAPAFGNTSPARRSGVH